MPSGEIGSRGGGTELTPGCSSYKAHWVLSSRVGNTAQQLAVGEMVRLRAASVWNGLSLRRFALVNITIILSFSK